ncbi:DUF1566 domain-containing protein [Pseudoalteromonas sp. MMG010]|uniref:Lcl C-terminal domain-containing protein n=1 Tax=Pseudoalteromonas sp. MMG010 TaxID=2822685 RepID=UPI001B39F988|nr:DUF1566 domain-containing protein [Pseudoalteromonas sp. MMG010]MBQ4833963.1 DUF1566 domain-containing protein [Pseudoalteromonas sp. MMG010]
MKALAYIPLVSCVLLSACGGGGSDSSADIQTTVNAGSDLNIIEKTDFTITATGSPDDGTYTWQRVSGPSIDGFPLDGAEQTLTAPDVKADSELILSVSYQTDNGSLVSDEVSIFITSNNQIPIAVVTQTAPETLPSEYNDVVTLSAEESYDPDENGQIDSYVWELLSGSTLEVDSFTNSTISFNHPLLDENTNFIWQLTVTDDEGGVSSIEYDLTLNETDEVVIAQAGEDQQVDEFDEVTLDATDSEVTTDTYSCEWEQLTGVAETLANSEQCTTSFIASDVDTNTEISFQVTVTDSEGRTDTDDVTIDITPKSLGLINDTGIDQCYNNTQRINCDSADFPEQDAELGRDSFANNLDKIGQGDLAFDYTKLNEFADEVSDESDDFSCIRDNVTGLVWEVKEVVMSTLPDTQTRAANNHYTWFITTDGTTAVGSTAGEANSTCPSDTHCGLQAYVDEVNDLDFCGGTNWRVPTYNELLGLLDYGKQGQDVLLNESFFPNTPDYDTLGHLRYWTSQTAADGTSLSQAYIIDMSNGNDLAYPKEQTAYVRLVRSR